MAFEQKEFMTSREAAKLLGVAVSSIQLWTDNGLLRAWTTGGGHRRIARSSVEAMLNQRHASTRSPVDGCLTVLLVDDKSQERNLFEQQFAARDLKFRLLTASNGFEGLVQIGRYLPDVIISDLKMPGMDGFQMIQQLQKMTELADHLIIAISALAESELEAIGGLPEQVKFMAKPIVFDDLEKILIEYADHLAQSTAMKVVINASI